MTPAAVLKQAREALKALREEVSAGCHPDALVEELKDGVHFEAVLQADAALAAIDALPEEEVTHVPPGPGDEYCNGCGLSQCYWDKSPRCHAYAPEEPPQ